MRRRSPWRGWPSAICVPGCRCACLCRLACDRKGVSRTTSRLGVQSLSHGLQDRETRCPRATGRCCGAVDAERNRVCPARVRFIPESRHGVSPLQRERIMSAHVERLCGTVALIAAFVACRDSSTELEGRPAARTPTFATAGTIPPGQVTVSWQENGLLQQRSEGTFEESANSGAFRYHSTGLSTSGSADGSGTVVGVSFGSTFYAQIGSTSNLTIVISH